MKAPIEINYVDDRIFLNFWDLMYGDDTVCLVTNEGKLITESGKGEEISLKEFIERVRVAFSKAMEYNNKLNKAEEQ